MTAAALEKPAPRSPQNLMDGILKQRDRLTGLRTALIETGVYDFPHFAFYRAQLDGLIDRAADAIGGGMHIVDMLVLFNEMEGFKE